MRVELRTEAISDLIEAAWFYERQRNGLGDQFSDAMFAHLAYLETVAGGHELVRGLHRRWRRDFHTHCTTRSMVNWLISLRFLPVAVIQVAFPERLPTEQRRTNSVQNLLEGQTSAESQTSFKRWLGQRRAIACQKPTEPGREPEPPSVPN